RGGGLRPAGVPRRGARRRGDPGRAARARARGALPRLGPAAARDRAGRARSLLRGRGARERPLRARRGGRRPLAGSDARARRSRRAPGRPRRRTARGRHGDRAGRAGARLRGGGAVSEPIISVRGLTKRFGDFTAVEDLALDVERGAIFAFLGANGSGKSTTIRMLIGLLQPTAGAITVDGIDVISNPRRVRDRLGYMGQEVSLFQGLTLP